MQGLEEWRIARKIRAGFLNVFLFCLLLLSVVKFRLALKEQKQKRKSDGKLVQKCVEKKQRTERRKRLTATRIAQPQTQNAVF